MINADSIWLDKLTDAHLSYGHSGGQLQDKAAFIHSLISGQSDFVTIDLSGQTIQLWGNTAIVRHTLAAVTKDNGKPGSVKLDVLLVWQKEQKEWKLIARQAVKPI
jgi:ketosteroid isomerase-like protein